MIYLPSKQENQTDLGSLEDDLHALVEGVLEVLQVGPHHHVGDGQHHVHLEQRGLGVLPALVAHRVANGLQAALDCVQRQASACGQQTGSVIKQQLYHDQRGFDLIN